MPPLQGPFISEISHSDLLWEQEYFGFHTFGKADIPQWFLNPFSGKEFSASAKHWSEISDFSEDCGDIKILWELSRFDWCVHFAANYRRTGDERWVHLLEKWLRSWCLNNPANQGPNWKCGQEAAIRVFHLATALQILERGIDTAALSDFFNQHLTRISATLSYAIAQDNNHGTSEAGALFIGGAVLANSHSESRKGDTWKEIGRQWLENRVRKLIEPDGTFSQYSTNYHRVLLDTLSMVEYFRRVMHEPEFSSEFYTRASAATTWLEAMMDFTTGDVPNFGTNDGARLFPLSKTDFRDFRPTLIRASNMFLKRNPITASIADEELGLLGIFKIQASEVKRESRLFPDGGLAVFHNSSLLLVCRVPNFRFRPSHADALHIDLWWKGENWLRDGGSYSYHADPKLMAYFSGTVSHNTVEFDNRDQMPRISRFLFGEWLHTRIVAWQTAPGGGSLVASYTDYLGAKHTRSIIVQESQIIVTDTIEGKFAEAKVRWRLKPGNWAVESTGCSLAGVSLSVEATNPITTTIEKGTESRYYMNMAEIPVFVVTSRSSNQIITRIQLRDK